MPAEFSQMSQLHPWSHAHMEYDQNHLFITERQQVSYWIYETSTKTYQFEKKLHLPDARCLRFRFPMFTVASMTEAEPEINVVTLYCYNVQTKILEEIPTNFEGSMGPLRYIENDGKELVLISCGDAIYMSNSRAEQGSFKMISAESVSFLGQADNYITDKLQRCELLSQQGMLPTTNFAAVHIDGDRIVAVSLMGIHMWNVVRGNDGQSLVILNKSAISLRPYFSTSGICLAFRNKLAVIAHVNLFSWEYVI